MAFLQLKNFARNYISFPLGTYGIAIMEAVSRSQTYVKYYFVCILYANIWYLPSDYYTQHFTACF